MGVFAMFRRKAKDAAEAPEEAQAATPTAESEEAVSASALAPEAGTSEAGPTEGAESDGAVDTAAVGPDVAVGAVEAVEIPKQQSAEEAADNEAGESARK